MTDIQKKREYFDLDDSEIAVLVEAYELIRSSMDHILDQFYEIALADRGMARFFDDPAVLAHARSRQQQHWDMLLSGKIDDRYLASATKTGEVHFRIDLPFSMYLGGYSRVVAMVLETILTKGRELELSGSRLNKMVCVASRAFAFDMENAITAFFDAARREQATALSILEDGLNRITKGAPPEPILDDASGGIPVRFDALRLGYNKALQLITGVSQTIGDMTNELEESVQDMNDATLELAKRTEAQAAAVLDSASAVDELTKSVKSSAENTARVDTEMKKARNQAADARSVVAEAVSSMAEIEEASREINNKIGAINQIAFQTNLLALNAGVEAARAGDQGRGFAVVASEVRALAVRASDTAKEISDIISKSSDLVASGTEKVGKTGEALEEISQNVNEVSELISKIDGTSREQTGSLDNINKSLGTLESMTQQNAAMAEETSAAAQTMAVSFEGLSKATKDLGGGGSENSDAGERLIA